MGFLGVLTLLVLTVAALAGMSKMGGKVNDELSPARADGGWQWEWPSRDEWMCDHNWTCDHDMTKYGRTNNSNGRTNYHGHIIASEPYWTYPIEHDIIRQHPSRYYYSFPDRYYC